MRTIAVAWAVLISFAAGADEVWVRIAASDSRAEARAACDFVCTGTNDEAAVQKAIDLNKLHICTDPAKRVWRDAMGNEVR